MLTFVAALFLATRFAAPPEDVQALLSAATPLAPVSKPAFVLDNASLATAAGLTNMTRERWAEAVAKHEAITVVETEPPAFVDATHARATIVVHRGDGQGWTDATTYADMARVSGQWTAQFVATEPTAWWKTKLADAVPIKYVGKGKPAPDIQPPVVVPESRVEPAYPELARRAHIAGIVILQTAIDKSGEAQSIQVLKGLPLGLTDAAADAVRRWRFKPAMRNGEPVNVLYVLTVNFKLSEDREDPLSADTARDIAKVAGLGNARVVHEDEERLLASKAIDDAMIRCDATTPVVCTVSLAKNGEWTKLRLVANDDRTRVAAATVEWWLPRAKTLQLWTIGSGDYAPVVLSSVDPKWPESLSVDPQPIVATVTVDATGELLGVRLLKPLPPHAAEAAIAALRQWKFAPGGAHDPSAVAYTLTTNFRR